MNTLQRGAQAMASQPRIPEHTILVVEDDADTRELVVSLLELEGYTAIAVEGVPSALEVLTQGARNGDRLCLVLLDIRLPGENGLAVLSYLNAQQSRVPVVAMGATPSLLRDAQAAGAQAALPKPFSLDELLALVQRYCPGPPSAHGARSAQHR